MKLADQITEYVHAACTGLWIQTHEPDEAQRELLQHAKQKQWRIAVWDAFEHPKTQSSAARSRPTTRAC